MEKQFLTANPGSDVSAGLAQAKRHNQRVTVMNHFRIGLLCACVILAGCASSGSNSGAGSSSKKNLASHTFSAREHKDVWERIRAGFGMQTLNDPKIDYWVNYYTRNPQSLTRMAQTSSKYIYYVTTELEKRDMPTELALLPFVESAYKTNAYSKSKAAGLWQFIPSTGQDYSLNQDWWGDDRRDPVYSTQAAIDYLSYLYDFQGGDWFLALASYNWGPNAVKKARDRNAANGLGTDFLSLNMPAETRNYVPKLLALKQIVSNPSRYGITLPHVADKPYFEEYKADKDMDVTVAAQLAGMSIDEFKELNASSTSRPVIVAANKRLLIPKNKLAQFKKNLASYKGELSTWTTYQPTTGESLSDIAMRHGVSVDTLKSLNSYRPGQTVALSSRPLLLPKASSVVAPDTPTQPQPSGQATPDVMLAVENRRREPDVPRSQGTPDYRNAVSGTAPKATVVASARPAPSQPQTSAVPDAQVSLAQNTVRQQPAQSATASDPLATLINSPEQSSQQAAAQGVQMASATVEPTTRYNVQRAAYSPAAQPQSMVRSAVYQPAPAARSGGSHVVAAGETMYSLARQYGTTVEVLSAMNQVTPTTLKAGMVLKLPGSS